MQLQQPVLWSATRYVGLLVVALVAGGCVVAVARRMRRRRAVHAARWRGVLAIAFGIATLAAEPAYLHARWLHVKLALVLLLVLSPSPVVWSVVWPVLLANATPLMPNATAMAEATSVFFIKPPTVE